MSTTLGELEPRALPQDLKERVLNLSDDARSELADLLLASLADRRAEIEAALDVKIKKRIAALDRGERVYSAEDVFAEAWLLSQ